MKTKLLTLVLALCPVVWGQPAPNQQYPLGYITPGAGRIPKADNTGYIPWTWLNPGTPVFTSLTIGGTGTAGCVNPTGTDGTTFSSVCAFANGNGLYVNNPFSLSTNYLSSTFTVGSGGATARTLVSLNGVGRVATTATSGVDALGIAQSTAAQGTAIEVAVHGIVACTTDNATTAGNLAIVGTTTAGYCKDAGTTSQTAVPAGTQIVGRFLTSVSGGATGSLELFGPGIFGALPATGTTGTGKAMLDTTPTLANAGMKITLGTSPGTPAGGQVWCYGDSTFAKFHCVNSAGTDTEYAPLATQVQWTAGTATLAQLNAGQTILAAVTGRTVRVVGIFLKVTGGFATCNDVRLSDTNGTPVDVLTVALAGLTTGNRIGDYTATNVTWGSFLAQLTADKGLQLRSTGTACTGGTSMDYRVFYTYS